MACRLRPQRPRIRTARLASGPVACCWTVSHRRPQGATGSRSPSAPLTAAELRRSGSGGAGSSAKLLTASRMKSAISCVRRSMAAAACSCVAYSSRQAVRWHCDDPPGEPPPQPADDHRRHLCAPREWSVCCTLPGLRLLLPPGLHCPARIPPGSADVTAQGSEGCECSLTVLQRARCDNWV
jgi:hypothetical protein